MNFISSWLLQALAYNVVETRAKTVLKEREEFGCQRSRNNLSFDTNYFRFLRQFSPNEPPRFFIDRFDLFSVKHFRPSNQTSVAYFPISRSIWSPRKVSSSVSMIRPNFVFLSLFRLFTIQTCAIGNGKWNFRHSKTAIYQSESNG